jgi:F-type H+-transporting ATPase subunit a
MRFFQLILALAFLVGAPLAIRAADAEIHAPAAGHSVSEAVGGHHESGLPQAAPVIKSFGVFKITNSMVVTWVVALFLIVFAQIATYNIKQVPEGAQNFWEWLVESLHDFLDGIIGHELVHKTFWFFATIFIFILCSNWVGLIPGVGSIGWGEPGPDGHLHHISDPLLRGANADLNMTLAMSMVFFVCWIFWALKANGPGGFIMHIFGPKGETAGLLKVLMIFVFMIVGVLEVVSILFRPISLSFRLYGNIFAGENMLETMATMNPALGWLFPIPFYFMELLVGLVQALVFMLLTAVFTLLICQHDESHGHGETAKH